jgi:hypothetical protein
MEDQLGNPNEPSRSFSEALELLKMGKKVTRIGWNGEGQFIEMQKVTDLSKMTKPYLFIHTVQGDLVPWLASQTDLLSNDWQEVE